MKLKRTIRNKAFLPLSSCCPTHSCSFFFLSSRHNVRTLTHVVLYIAAVLVSESQPGAHRVVHHPLVLLLVVTDDGRLVLVR
jgi:hypothetical protein